MYVGGAVLTSMAAMASAAAGGLSVSRVVADAQEKTKGYLPRIEDAVGDPGQCMAESHLDEGVVKYGKRSVGKVWEVAQCGGCCLPGYSVML